MSSLFKTYFFIQGRCLKGNWARCSLISRCGFLLPRESCLPSVVCRLRLPDLRWTQLRAVDLSVTCNVQQAADTKVAVLEGRWLRLPRVPLPRGQAMSPVFEERWSRNWTVSFLRRREGYEVNKGFQTPLRCLLWLQWISQVFAECLVCAGNLLWTWFVWVPAEVFWWRKWDHLLDYWFYFIT